MIKKNVICKKFFVFFALLFLVSFIVLAIVKIYNQKKEIVCFGNYYIDSDYKKPIEWIIVHRNLINTTMISVDLVECCPYDENAVDWSSSSLRCYLNESFYNAAFSEDEKQVIVLTEVVTDHRWISYESGRKIDSSFDYVYIPDYRDLNKIPAKYLKARFTPYCINKYLILETDEKEYYDNGYSPWWLRSPGSINYLMMAVMPDGNVSNKWFNPSQFFYPPDSERVGVRIAITVDNKKLSDYIKSK